MRLATSAGPRWLAVLAALMTLGCTERDRDIPPPPPNASQSDRAPSMSATPKAVAPLAPAELVKYCHSGFPLEGVYTPERLTVKNPCAAVTGIAWAIDREHDGDMHISLTGVDARWLNSVNVARPQHDLVVEAVPGIPVGMPPLKSRITVIGPWVLDTETGWLEIHPVWAIIRQ